MGEGLRLEEGSDNDGCVFCGMMDSQCHVIRQCGNEEMMRVRNKWRAAAVDDLRSRGSRGDELGLIMEVCEMAYGHEDGYSVFTGLLTHENMINTRE